MKRFYETWTNPKSRQVEQIEVCEYSFEDWESGLISGNWEPGKQLVHSVTENKYYYRSLNSNEFSKIEARREEYYFAKVEKETEKYISIFRKRYEISEAKERLLQTEIELYEKLLFPEKLPIYTRTNMDFPLDEMRLPSGELPDFSKLFAKDGKGINPGYNNETIQFYSPIKLDSITICGIRDMYKKIIVNGERDFTFTNSPNCGFKVGAGDFHFIRAEAIARYYNYLLELKQDKGKEISGTGEDSSTKKYNSLKEIFINEAAYIECMEALRDIKNPVISDTNKYLLGKRMKGAFTAWFELIKNRGKIKTVSNAVMAELLNKEIKGLDLYKDGSTLGDLATTHFKKYYTPLSKIIPQHPLSPERR